MIFEGEIIFEFGQINTRDLGLRPEGEGVFDSDVPADENSSVMKVCRDVKDILIGVGLRGFNRQVIKSKIFDSSAVALIIQREAGIGRISEYSIIARGDIALSTDTPFGDLFFEQGM